MQQNVAKPEIALQLGKHISSIYNEIARNSDGRSGKYFGNLAIRKCQKRHIEKSINQVFTADMELYITKLIKLDLSPEQIVGKAKLDGLSCVFHERIYTFIYADKKKGGNLFKHLRSKGKLYRKRGAAKDKRGQIVGRTGIEERPKEVDLKQRIGDLEIDLVIGKDHKGVLLTINDRLTGMVQIKKIESKDSELVKNATIELLEIWKPYLHTITSDNGKEFAQHKQIAQALDISYYFANPYSSWERGANENLNGLIRQYFPKSSDFSQITDEEVQIVMDKLNNRPRKRHQYKTPNEIHLKMTKNNNTFAFIN